MTVVRILVVLAFLTALAFVAMILSMLLIGQAWSVVT